MKTEQEVMMERFQFTDTVHKSLNERGFTPNECYPFDDITELEAHIQSLFSQRGIEYKGYERLGETLTFGGIWESEGRSFEMNVNPTKFRNLQCI